MPARLWISLALCVLCSACGTPGRSGGPMVEGADLEMHLRNTPVLWSADVQRAADMLAARRPKELDKPLRLALVVRPGVLVDSEISIRFAVDVQGHVVDARILEAAMATGDQSIAVATLRTLRMWRFDPPTREGTPTGYCCVRVTIENVPAERPFERPLR